MQLREIQIKGKIKRKGSPLRASFFIPNNPFQYRMLLHQLVQDMFPLAPSGA